MIIKTRAAAAGLRRLRLARRDEARDDEGLLCARRPGAPDHPGEARWHALLVSELAAAYEISLQPFRPHPGTGPRRPRAAGAQRTDQQVQPGCRPLYEGPRVDEPLQQILAGAFDTLALTLAHIDAARRRSSTRPGRAVQRPVRQQVNAD